MNYIDVKQIPDMITVQSETSWNHMTENGDIWQYEDITVKMISIGNGVTVFLTAFKSPVSRLIFRWKKKIGDHVRILNDHWERGYGDLEWASIMPDRVLPWYFLSSDGSITNGYGVKTMPNSMCSWQVDANCITLILDVRCGGCGVRLTGRTLEAASIVCRKGAEGEDPFVAAQEFCRMMCENPVLPKFPVYGGNNWYYAYGKSSHAEILEDSKLISELAGDAKNRPFMVIDAGWHSYIDEWYLNDNDPWADDTQGFPDMAKLAVEMKACGVHPGLWFRPLLTSNRLPKEWLLKTNRVIKKNTDGLILDPSIPEVLDTITAYMKRFADWGYELVKHDFVTYDILGRWGFDCGANITESGWHFADRSKTTAEVMIGLFKALKSGAPEVLLIGCNTISHLSAGIFEINRTGDDTSGEQWERSRKMGINSLAFRMPQHATFYAADADCVGLTNNIDWNLNKQFLDVLANSGTVLLVSADPKAMGEEQKKAVAEAFAIASQEIPVAQPLDWMDNATPSKWLIRGKIKEYDWVDYSRLQSCSGAAYEEI
jgi:alpha-galactosidase